MCRYNYMRNSALSPFSLSMCQILTFYQKKCLFNHGKKRLQTGRDRPFKLVRMKTCYHRLSIVKLKSFYKLWNLKVKKRVKKGTNLRVRAKLSFPVVVFALNVWQVKKNGSGCYPQPFVSQSLMTHISHSTLLVLPSSPLLCVVHWSRVFKLTHLCYF